MKSTLLLALIGFSFSSAWAQLSNDYRYEPNYSDSQLSEKKCSGQLGDLNCYATIIAKSAHELNVRDGIEEAPPSKIYEAAPKRKVVYHGQRIIVDTEDRKSCEEIKKFITMTGAENAEKQASVGLKDLCEPSGDRYRIVTLMGESYEEYLTPIKLDFLKNTESSLGVDTRNLTLVLVGALGALWAAPESVSKWDKEAIRAEGLFNKWKKNVRSRPVVDEDDWAVNYIGHPVSGMAWYTLARSNGASPLASFGYSALVSTFFWEYGFEALAETPSIQDLIVTPVLGAILGEIAFKWSKRIEAKGGTVFGSDRLGSTVLFILNPVKSLSNKINKLVRSNLIQNAEGNLVISKIPIAGDQGPRKNYVGFEIKFKF